jgi:hypothetical protein
MTELRWLWRVFAAAWEWQIQSWNGLGETVQVKSGARQPPKASALH